MATIDKTYRSLLEEVLEKGYEYEDPNRKGVRRLQIPHYNLEHDLSESFPAITSKKLAWKSVVAELLWILSGDTNIKYLVDNNCPIWNEDAYSYFISQQNEFSVVPAKEWFIELIRGGNESLGNLGKVYGYQLRKWGGWFDQLDFVIRGLIANPMSTRLKVQMYNPDDQREMSLPACHDFWQVMCEPFENSYKINLHFHMRSWDLFLGANFNLSSYALLCHILAKITGYTVGKLYVSADNPHLYDNQIISAKEQLTKDIYKYKNCQLEIKDRPEYLRLRNDYCSVSNFLSNLEIDDFKLVGYDSYEKISVPMLPYSK